MNMRADCANRACADEDWNSGSSGFDMSIAVKEAIAWHNQATNGIEACMNMRADCGNRADADESFVAYCLHSG